MPRQRRFAVLYLAVFVDQLGFGILLPFLPLYAGTLGASGFEVGLVLAIYSLMQMAVSTSWGRLSDRIGRRPVIVASAAGAAAGFVVLGLADSLAMVFAGRALLGGFGVAMSTAQAWIADTTPREDRGRALALLGGVGGLGFVLGPAIGALGIIAGGMRLPFFVSAACAAGNALLAATLLPDGRVLGAASAHATSAGARSAAPARASLAAATEQATTSAAPAPRSSLAASPPAAWRVIAPCLVVAFVLNYAFSNIEATFALFTHDALGFDAAANGWLFVALGFVAALTQAVGTRWLAGRLDEPRCVGLGLALLAGGAAILPLAHSLAQLLPAVATMAVGLAITSPSLTAWVSRRAPADRQGELLGLAQSTAALARVVGPGVGGLLFDHVGHGSPFWIAAGVLGGAAVALWATR